MVRHRWTLRSRLARLALALSGSFRVRWPPGPHPRPEEAWWTERFAEKQAEFRQRPADVLFLGDSIFHNWELRGPPEWRDYAPTWERFYASRNAVNLGFAGDGTPHLLWRVQNWDFANPAPKLAVILIGVNDLLVAGRPASAVVDGIVAIVNTLRLKLPPIRVLLLGLLPNRISARVTRETARVNAALRARDWTGTDLRFLELDWIFLRNGRTDPTQYADPFSDLPVPILLHPTAAAQARLAEAMEPVLAEMCSPSATANRTVPGTSTGTSTLPSTG